MKNRVRTMCRTIVEDDITEKTCVICFCDKDNVKDNVCEECRGDKN